MHGGVAVRHVEYIFFRKRRDLDLQPFATEFLGNKAG